VAAATDRATRQQTPVSGARPVLRFALGFAVLVVVFNVVYYGYLANTAAVQSYLAASAWASATIMSWLGTTVSSSGPSIHGPAFSMTVAVGCDAIQPAALFGCAVLASPLSWRSRMGGLMIGVPLLLLLNLVRIITLFYAGLHFRSAFDVLHIDVWQGLFIVAALLLWIVWFLRAQRSPATVSKPATSSGTTAHAAT
jgi:exosortase/archaeosortase family protein